MSENIISIPVLFDIGGDAIVFGEETPDDFVNSHLDFVLDMTTEANDISLNAADISSAILIGDNDTDDNIFYSGGSSGNIAVDILCNRIAKAITRGKLVHLPKSGDHSNSGIPMGGRLQLANNLGELGSSYATKYMTSIAPIGDEQMLGQAMARVASVHLVGSPLPAGIFEDQNQIQTDLETASSQTFNSGNTAFYNALAVQLSKVLGGSKSSAPMNNGSGAPQSGGDLASQIFYESFDNQDVALQASHDTEYVTGRYGGKAISTYAGSGAPPNGYQWVQRTSDSTLPASVKAVSFHLKIQDGFTSGRCIFDNRDSNSEETFTGTTGGLLWLHSPPQPGALKYLSKDSGTYGTASGSGFLPTGDQITLYVDGVGPQLYQTTQDPTDNGLAFLNISTSAVAGKINIHDENWHHFYIEYPDGESPSCFKWLSYYNSGLVIQGVLDEVRFFNAALTPTQIADLATGKNGNGGDSVIPPPSPYDLASQVSTLYTGSTAQYSHSSTYPDDQHGHYAFNGDPNSNKVWTSFISKYHNGEATYSDTTTVDGVSVQGEWIQVDIGQSVVVTEFKHLASKNGDYGYRANAQIKTAILASSTDGTTWTQIGSTSFPTVTTTESTHTPTATPVGRYYRYIATSNHGDDEVQLKELTLIGQTEAQYNAANPAEGTNSYPFDASGVAVPALKSIYEQLMNVPGRSQIMQTRDVGGVVDNSNVTLAGGFPFISGDKLVMYLRPKIVFANQTKAQQNTTLVGFSEGVTLNTPVFNVGRDGQGITGQTYSQSSVYPGQYGADKAFDGTVSGGYGYLGGGNFDNNTGAYNKATPDNTSVDGTNLAGEWIQVNVGKKVAVTSYKIYPQNWEKHSIGGRSPHIFKLVYSDDGTNFLTADSQTVGTDNMDTSEWATTNDNAAVYIPKTFTLTNTKVGQYWRLIITSLYGNGYSNGGTVSIQELELNGSDDFTGSGDSGAVDVSGLQTNIVATSQNIEDAFPGNDTTGPEPEVSRWGWMGSANSDSLSLETTDVKDVTTCDLHIWKITITL